ncbi:MAG: hypothetical protein JRN20_21905 [Nitrososphaerota archaeon]|nr:hypothetical protein [Nitrososphaerota archaeon]
MVTFAPQFFIVLGVDVFLGASILTVMLDKHFPSGLPYILDIGSFVGFAELLVGPQYLASFSPALQFYYSFIYSLVAVLSMVAINLYLLFANRRRGEVIAAVAIFATIPSVLVVLFFASAYVNGLQVELPIIPALPIVTIYEFFLASASLVVGSLIITKWLEGRAVKGGNQQPAKMLAHGLFAQRVRSFIKKFMNSLAVRRKASGA